jgi:hypothetical protein
VTTHERHVVDELSSYESWRIFRIMAEFIEGVEHLIKSLEEVSL